ncbi:hypothetical protein M9434_004894 [Picochlorum sp. BPE23]|nr:hypothetical protein M9434_004894 [Picochlorum sp. BPE23]
MSGANVRKRTREEEELAQSRPQIQRRSKIEIGYIVAQFRRKVIANNGLCTGCGKQLMSLNELAEYEFDFTQETVVKHADQKCVHPRVVSLDEDIVMSTGICVSDESEDDSREENEEDVDEDEDEDEGQPGESSEHCDSWECHLLLNADPIQAKGSRQTGLMLRFLHVPYLSSAWNHLQKIQTRFVRWTGTSTELLLFWTRASNQCHVFQ